MNKITGAILMVAAAISGHGVLVFLGNTRQFYRYDISPSASRMILAAVGTSVVLGLWGVVLLFKRDVH